MVEVHLYGKLRRFSDNQDPAHHSIVHIQAREADTINDILKRIGIPRDEVGNNIFLNGRYSSFERKVKNGDRLGVFPDNMAMVIV